MVARRAPAVCSARWPGAISQVFEQRLQAQIQGLFEMAVLIAVGAAVPVYSNVLYDARATDKLEQARPFFVSFALVSAGTALVLLMSDDERMIAPPPREAPSDEVTRTRVGGDPPPTNINSRSTHPCQLAI